MTGLQPHLEDKKMTVHRVVAGPLDNNVWVIGCRATGEAVIVDAAAEPGLILEAVAGRPVSAIVTTHSHADHHGAAAAVRDATGAQIMVHPADAPAIAIPGTIPIEDGDTITCGDLELEVIHIPGHTPGSVCLRIGNLVFSGVTLFPGGPGATTDAARFSEIMRGVESRLFTLPDETLVLPGHGAETTIGEERPSLPEWRRRGY
jgi:glyoxylase-like metal-dependent hydrolase (beta-lactamase superfamily II)